MACGQTQAFFISRWNSGNGADNHRRNSAYAVDILGHSCMGGSTGGTMNTTTHDAASLEEIRSLWPERTRLIEQLAALDRRIAELAGANHQDQRKPVRKTLTRAEFARGCGV